MKPVRTLRLVIAGGVVATLGACAECQPHKTEHVNVHVEVDSLHNWAKSTDALLNVLIQCTWDDSLVVGTNGRARCNLPKPGIKAPPDTFPEPTYP
jgi:hypothetical protein